MSESEPEPPLSETEPEPGTETGPGLVASLAGVARDTLRLVELETRLAGVNLVWMLALGLFAALLLISAWLMASFALGWWLSGLGWSRPLVFLALGALDLLAAVLCALLVARVARRLGYPATRRQLQRIAGIHKDGRS